MDVVDIHIESCNSSLQLLWSVQKTALKKQFSSTFICPHFVHPVGMSPPPMPLFLLEGDGFLYLLGHYPNTFA